MIPLRIRPCRQQYGAVSRFRDAGPYRADRNPEEAPAHVAAVLELAGRGAGQTPVILVLGQRFRRGSIRSKRKFCLFFAVSVITLTYCRISPCCFGGFQL